jgi:3-hydroxyacyl-CoA dehydrogenase
MAYRALKKVELAALDGAKTAKSGSERLRRILQSDDKSGRFVWKLLSETWCYATRRIPEIADRIVDIDRAMRGGWGWEAGPFELWDSAGVADTVKRLEADGGVVPESIKRMLAGGKTRFYEDAPEPSYYDLVRGQYAPEPRAPGLILLRRGTPTPPVVEQNAAASLRDLGDGVLCVEFHSKLNTVGPDTMTMVNRGFDELSRNFDAMVIGNQGAAFSAGADLALLLRHAQAGQFNEIDKIIHDFQQMNLLIEYSPKPIVVAPFSQTLGGGCEMTLASRRAQAYTETRIGLVETAVGLIPAAGGVKEMLLRTSDAAGPHGDLLAGVRTLFQNISMARASSCADEALQLGYLRPSDGITINPDRLLADAKAAALEMARQGYRPPHSGPRRDVRVLGQAGAAELKINVHLARQGNYISDYDAHIAGKLAYVLCGGAVTAPSMVSEQYLLDLEREAFVSLCGEPLTQARIQHTLKTGKPLRN